MQYIGKLKKFSHIKNLPNPQIDDLAYCEERHEYYIYGEDGWKKRKINTKAQAEISLYEVNKNFYETQEPITDEAILNEKIELVNRYDRETKNNYYMLLCKEMSYYTILKKEDCYSDTDFTSLGDAITQLFLEQNWVIYDIYQSEETGAIELWTKDPNHETDNEIHCMILFGYDLGVVTFGGQ